MAGGGAVRRRRASLAMVAVSGGPAARTGWASWGSDVPPAPGKEGCRPGAFVLHRLGTWRAGGGRIRCGRSNVDLVAPFCRCCCSSSAAAWARSFLPERLRITSAEGKLILLFYDPQYDYLARRWGQEATLHLTRSAAAALLSRVAPERHRSTSPPPPSAGAQARFRSV